MRKTDGWSRQDFACNTTYQLCISYPNQSGEDSPNPGLERAYRALWSASCLDGPWTEPEDIGTPNRKILPTQNLKGLLGPAEFCW